MYIHLTYDTPGSGYLREFTEVASARLRQRVINGDPSALTLRGIIDGVFGRPPTNPRGPTPLDINPPLLNCDTKSYQDLLKIYAMCVRLCLFALFIVLYGDGQTVLRARDLKRKFPNQHRYRDIKPLLAYICVCYLHGCVRRAQESRDWLRSFSRYGSLDVCGQ